MPPPSVDRKKWLAAAAIAGLGTVAVTSYYDTPAVMLATTDLETERTPAAEVHYLTRGESEYEPAPFMPTTRIVVVGRGDNLMGVLARAGVGRRTAHAAIMPLKGVYDLRRDLHIGDRLELTFGRAGAEPAGPAADAAPRLTLTGLRLPLAWDRDVEVRRNGAGAFHATELIKPLKRLLARAGGTISASLHVDGTAAGIPPRVLAELIRLYSFDVDFQRELRAGDEFTAMYARFVDPTGIVVHDGAIEYARLVLRGTALPLYRYRTTAGTLGWFNAMGASLRKTVMKTPIDGARLSSRFRKRVHPILGFTRLHAGVDFAAPRGTPIYAAGDGRIVALGRKGNYGNYIRIRHNGTYQTAYGHLNGYVRGLKRGSRVRQGQVIGYVGSTGRSTGPHLHYEIHRNGRPINPPGLKLPSREKLTGRELARFQAHRAELDRQYHALAGPTHLAADRTCDGPAPAVAPPAPC